MKVSVSSDFTATEVKVTFGSAARAKAEHREEATRRELERTLSERLEETISLMQSPRHERSNR